MGNDSEDKRYSVIEIEEEQRVHKMLGADDETFDEIRRISRLPPRLFKREVMRLIDARQRVKRRLIGRKGQSSM